MNNQNTINEIRSKIDIVDLIGEYFPLVKKGQYYWGVCPFHNDRNPSMSVDPNRQTFHCWTCHTSGNVFKFIEHMENLTFPEALSFLGEKVGIAVGKTYTSNQEQKNLKYYEMYDLASKFYQLMLNTDKGTQAKEYLTQRGITNEIIKEFGIGLSLNDRNKLTKYLQEKGYDINTIETLGLAMGDNDTFISRIMFPIEDRNGRIVAFSGRRYDGIKTSKYINSKEMSIFKKSNCLYNYHNCKEHVRTSKYVIVMEGFMDVIRASTIGIKNVVAIMGTALTEEHISMLKKLSQNIYLCLDGDNPGQEAMLSIGQKLEEAGLMVKVVELADDEDPDSYILKHGQEKFVSLIENAVNYSDFKIKVLKNGVNFKSDIELSNYINRVIQEVSNIEDEIRREIILKKLATETNLSYNTIEKKLNEYLSTKEKKVGSVVKTKPKSNMYTKAALGFIYGMLIQPKNINIYEKEQIYFQDTAMRYLAEEIAYYYHQYGDIVIADFYTYLNDKKELLALYEKVIASDFSEEIEDNIIQDYVLVIKNYNKRQEIKGLNEMMKREVDELEKAKIAERIRKLMIEE